MLEADYVIVGTGTAGCVLANRLSADPACQVLAIEAGPEDASPWIRIPAGVAKLFTHPRLVWPYETEPEAQLGGRTLYWPRGKVIGGTSSINGMTYVRGQADDYDGWATLAGPEWSYEAVLPYFRRLEDHPLGPSRWHGVGGPVRVGFVAYRHRVSEAFHAALVAAGVPANDDYNGPRQEGVSFNQVMMHGGRRVSAASAYLDPVRNRPNLRVLTRTAARRILFEGRRAVGVEVMRVRTRDTVRARREVLLCAGAIASPQLLMLSGVGPGSALQDLGIHVVAPCDAVGRDLQEHVRTQLVVRTRVATFNQEAHGVALLRHVLRYATQRRGLLTATASQVNAFVRSSAEITRPDITIVFRPASGDYRGRRFVSHDFPGVMAMVGLMRPRSRGSVSLRSADPHDPPSIVSGHLVDPDDFVPLLRGVRLLRRVLATAPLQALVAAEVQPGDAVQDDAALQDYVKSNANSLFHAVGTCAMGLDGRTVTTPQLRVRGVEGLRVIDASVMPAIPSGNTCAPVLMVAEKAADLILGRRAALDAQSALAAPAA
jgi:choline dehydrogenase